MPQVIQFNIDKVNLCIDLRYVIKSIFLVELEPVPESPAYLAGLLNYHGKIMPVIDLGMYLGMPRKLHYTVDTPMIICSDGNKNVALIVEEVSGIQHIDDENIDENNQFDKQISSFTSVIKTDDLQALLINIPQILKTDLLNKKSRTVNV